MSHFAPMNDNLSYWQKQTKPLFPDLSWNIPEQKTGSVSLIGGNIQSFSTVIRTAEFLKSNFPLKHANTILPSSLKAKLPSFEDVTFTPATASGSFAKSSELSQAFDANNFSIIIGDLSFNAETAVAITDAAKNSITPLLLTRDSIDLLAPTIGQIIAHPNLFFVGSMSQLQKIFRSLYYPRMIMLTQPLIPILETLHKFTLTYSNVTLLTFHQDNIIVANNGNVSTTHLVDTNFTPISLWSGQLASKVTALNLYNPGKPFESTTAAILYQ